jgi:CDP-paratose 2-epimerase
MKYNLSLVVGGAGFIGFHVCERLLREGYSVVVADNLSRGGARANLQRLLDLAPSFGGQIKFIHCDIRSQGDLEEVFKAGSFELVVHEAAQVAVTTSVTNPRLDFEINALGTFNLLEAVRLHSPDSFFIYASTNKVYGGMEDVVVEEHEKRYGFRDLVKGVPEERFLDFHSPYACSKGVADQYVHDYSRIYGLRSTVFRQSCIFGTSQFGIEDQGWIAWFTIAKILGRKVTIYGNGKQVRDILWAPDLVDAYIKAFQSNAAGKVYNIGGGPENTLSLLELIEILNSIDSQKIEFGYGTTRPGDQPVYVSSIEKVSRELGWSPSIKPAEGVKLLHAWVKENKKMISQLLGYQ